MPGWIKWILFGSSYTPFFLILLLREATWDAGSLRLRLPWFALFLAVMILVSNGVLLFLMRRIPADVNPDCSGEVERVTSKSGESLSYIATYLIPFLEFEVPKDLLSLLVLMSVVGILYVSSDLIYINPMLAMFGYRVYEVALQGQPEPLILITRGRPRKRETLQAALLTRKGDVYLEVETTGGGK